MDRVAILICRYMFSTRAYSLHFQRQIKSIGIVPKWIHQWLGVSVPQRLMRSARNLWNGRSICMKHWKCDIDMRNLEGITSAANTELHFETWNALVAGRTRSQKLWNTRTSANLYRLTMLKMEPQTLIMYWTKWIIWFLTCDFWGYVRDNLQVWLKRQTREVQESYNQNCKWFSFVNFDLQDNGLSKTLQHCSVGEPTTVYCGSWRLLPKLWMNATNWTGKLFMKSVRAIAPCETCKPNNETSRQVQAKKLDKLWFVLHPTHCFHVAEAAILALRMLGSAKAASSAAAQLLEALMKYPDVRSAEALVEA